MIIRFIKSTNMITPSISPVRCSHLITTLLFFSTICLFPFTSYADETAWRKEYNSICGNRQEAVVLSKEELVSLIDKCDHLLYVINASENPRKKIYIFRLTKCRNFYRYLADTIEIEGVRK